MDFTQEMLHFGFAAETLLSCICTSLVISNKAHRSVIGLTRQQGESETCVNLGKANSKKSSGQGGEIFLSQVFFGAQNCSAFLKSIVHFFESGRLTIWCHFPKGQNSTLFVEKGTVFQNAGQRALF